MEKLKNFIYSKNDIVIAIVVLVVALGVIFFRVKALVDYPKKLVEEQNAMTVQEPKEVSPSSSVKEQEKTEVDTEENTEKNNQQQDTENEKTDTESEETITE